MSNLLDACPPAFLKELVHAISEGVLAYDRERRYTLWNPVMERLSGLTADKVLGHRAEEIFPFLVETGEIGLFDLTFQGERAHSSDRPYYIPETGKQGYFSGRYFPLENESGEIIGGYAILTDVTEKYLRQQNERLKQAAEERFRYLADDLPQLLWITDLKGEVEYINKRWFSYTGQTDQSWSRKTWWEATHPDDLDRVREAQKAALSELSTFEVEYRLRRHDGEYRWHLARTVVVTDENGKPLRRFGTATDIHDKKMAEQAKAAALHERDRAARNLAIVNAVGQKLTSELELEKLVQSVTDAATQVSNAAFGAFFYKAQKDHGESLMLYTLSGAPKEAFAKFPLPRNTAVFNPTFMNEGTVRSDDITKDPRYGSNSPNRGMPPGHLPVRSYLAVSVVSQRGEVIGGLFLGHPEPGVFTEDAEKIVEGLAAQAAIAMDNARLYQKLQESVRARDEFLSIASHELKTPLTSLTLQTQLRHRQLRKGQLEFFEADKLAAYFESDSRQLTKINRLIDDMLDISRIRTGRLELTLEKTDLAKLVRETIERMRPQLADVCCDVTLSASHEVWIELDSFRIEQVMMNLLTNAMKYGKGKPVEVAVEAAASPLSGAVIKVRDQGIGIKENDQRRIFSRFERAVSHKEISGLGLGLAIAKDMVEAHGGTITVESAPNKGSTFIVTLPAAPSVPSQNQ